MKKDSYLPPKVIIAELTFEHNCLLDVSGGNIENPSDGGDWTWDE